MKKASLLTAALIALGIVSQASADQIVYVTGSTAFRGVAYNAFVNANGPAGGGVFDKPGTVVGGVTAPSITEAERGGSSASGANYMLFHGNVNGTATYINCAWSGSDAGMASVANITIDNDGTPLFGAPETWMTNTVTGFLAAQPTTGELESGSRQGDIAFADTSVASALPAILTANTAHPLKSYGAMAVVTFTWLKNNNSASGASAAKTAWTDLTNVSTYQLQALFANGELPADYFTGVAADNSTPVYLVGRNKGSGTRANALNDSQFGLNSPVIQCNIGGNLTGTPVLPSPMAVNYNDNNDDGYESGGAVTTALGFPGSTSASDANTGASGWYAIGYASTGDAQKNGVTTANWLTENGVFESNGAIISGEYSYWGYENLYGRSNVGGTFADSVGTSIFNAVVAGNATGGTVASAHDSGINLTKMNCVKSTDFSFPTHN